MIDNKIHDSLFAVSSISEDLFSILGFIVRIRVRIMVRVRVRVKIRVRVRIRVRMIGLWVRVGVRDKV